MALPAERVHALLLPMSDRFLLVPSALVAEIVPLPELVSVPLAPQWLTGVMNWRQRPVPVCDLGRFWGPPVSLRPGARAIVMYPLPGRRAHEFFAILAGGEPQSRTIDGPSVLLTDEDAVHPYIAVSLDIDGKRAGIPDLPALKELFYESGPD